MQIGIQLLATSSPAFLHWASSRLTLDQGWTGQLGLIEIFTLPHASLAVERLLVVPMLLLEQGGDGNACLGTEDGLVRSLVRRWWISLPSPTLEILLHLRSNYSFTP